MSKPSLNANTSKPSRDPGLQPERTGLAWSRTAFVVLINAVLIARSGLTHHELIVTAAGFLMLAAAAAMYVYGSVRTHHLARLDIPVTPSSVTAMRLLTALVILGSGAALYMAIGALAVRFL
ncbi:DUF202 domain-containing protein [Phytohalomonas tamaricis]|uniref:DUF202 domain-containing protein n=1 Tax=Phytohalomonas tamaricis TaxID=2081032 RepID=UPI000D0BD514|nr:DUF202 domain-containing protein [Phytohalomonas tamaricis]